MRVDGAAFTWEAIYDGFGRRLKTVYTPMGGESVETLSYYDPAVAFLEIGVEVEGETAWKVYGLDLDKTYGGLQGIGGLRAIIQDGNVIRIIDDVQGNILGYVDADNKITWNSFRDYDAYGPLGELESGGCKKSLEKLLDSNSLSLALAKSHAWRGKRQEVNGLIYFGKRYYDPTTGRFISPDPLGHSGSIDLYSYANGDPVNFVDPSGMFACAAMEGVRNNIDGIQLGLDAGGFIPVIGIGADALNAAIDAARGDWALAGVGILSAVPLAGDSTAGMAKRLF